MTSPVRFYKISLSGSKGITWKWTQVHLMSPDERISTCSFLSKSLLPSVTADSHMWQFKFQLIKIEWYYKFTSSGKRATFRALERGLRLQLRLRLRLPQSRSRALPSSQRILWAWRSGIAAWVVGKQRAVRVLVRFQEDRAWTFSTNPAGRRPRASQLCHCLRLPRGIRLRVVTVPLHPLFFLFSKDRGRLRISAFGRQQTWV